MESKPRSKHRNVLYGVDLEKVKELSKHTGLLVLRIRNYGTLNIGKPSYNNSSDSQESSESTDIPLVSTPINVEKKNRRERSKHRHHHREHNTPKQEEQQTNTTTQTHLKKEMKDLKKSSNTQNIEKEKEETVEHNKEDVDTKKSNGLKIEELDDEGKVISEVTPFETEHTGVPKNFANATNDPEIDQQLAMGYFLVNNGKLQDAIKYLTQFLVKYPKVAGGYIARGTALAMGGAFNEAVADFGSAITLDPDNFDAHKRRGQTLIGIGKLPEALADMDAAVKLSKGKDPDVYKQRGIVHQMMRNYEKARDDFEVVVKKMPGDAVSWNHFGLNNTALGLFREAAEGFGRAVSINPEFVECYVNLAQLEKDAGQPKRAEGVFKIIFNKVPKHPFAHYLRGVMLQQIGNHIEATKEFDISVANMNDEKYGMKTESDKVVDLWRYRGVTESGSGQFRKAAKDFDEASEIKCDDSAWYMKEVAMYTHHMLDKEFKKWNLDSFDPLFKEGFCKHLIPAALHRYDEQPGFDDNVKDITENDVPSEEVIKQILYPAMNIGKYMQYESQGFVHNVTQYLMAGMSAIEIGKLIRARIPQWAKGGLTQEEAQKQIGKITWREMMEISTRWRQVSEPNDPVFWIDGLTPDQFEEGFGAHTPMYTGQGRVIRYFCQYNRAFKLVQKLLPEQVTLKPEWAKRVKEAKNIDDILKLVESNFQVVTPCRSDNFDDPKTGERIVYDGTNLVTEMKEPYGYDFAIKTTCKRSRWTQYDKELEACWNKLQLLVLTRKTEKFENDEFEKIIRAMYSFTFFWYNFMPLTRGTAAGGMVFMMAILASLGKQVGKHIPTGMQTDWEAILCEYPSKFADVMYGWMKDSIVDLDIDNIPVIEQKLPTLRSIIECFNYCPKVKCE